MKLVMPRSLVVTFVFFALSGSALATHEADHRYHIKGYVLDEKQMPLSDTDVSILMNNQVLGFGNTDADGFYSIRLHLHDSDRGKKLQIKTAAGVADIRVMLTPGDKSTKRVHYANFSGGQFLEKKLPRRGFPVWGYGIIIVVIGTAAVMVERHIKRRKRRLLNREKKKKKNKRRH
ncbi:MAG: hypothetical protein E2O37_06605 [Proteobacteria bacterium]|nr:MAG: hypothetical protein E2O37_06605 [Pseudomonadota bacterium]TDJ71922.1 MAG: hypothetical protein E2O38_06540 [Pseudomonadota bacterium]